MAPAATLHLSAIFFSVVIVITLTAGAGAAAAGFSAELYHRDSLRSPFRNLSLATPADRLRAAALRSVSRAADIASGGVGIRSRVTPGNFEYLMKLYVGTPPVELHAIVDTGSDLIWVQCAPCDPCYKQRAPLFDPAASSSYRGIPCGGGGGGGECVHFEISKCGEHGDCEFRSDYGDGSWTFGYLATETLSFDDDGEAAAVSVPDVVFGCAHSSGGKFEEDSAGLVGLGAGNLSLVTQLSPIIHGRFSYCLVPFADNGSSSVIFFGNDDGDGGGGSGEVVTTTPIFSGSEKTFYNLNLESIVVSGAEDQPVNVPSDGDGGGGGGNIVIDSGTTYTLLPRSVVEQLHELLAARITTLGPRVFYPNGTFGLCYSADYSSIIGVGGDIPVIKLKFQGVDEGDGAGAWVALQPMNTFVPVAEGLVCLAIVEDENISILGNVAQMNFHVVYDTSAMRLSFSPVDCAAAAAAAAALKG